MANKFQKLLYNLSVASPILISFAIVWYNQKKTLIIPALCFAAAGILIVCMLCAFSYGKKHLAPIVIRTNNISPNDKWIAVYIISYLVPFADMVIDDFNPVLCTLIVFLMVLIAGYANDAIPNPILYLCRYHFYSVEAENGISEYVVISKRILRKKQDLKTVKRVFEFLMMDTEG